MAAPEAGQILGLDGKAAVRVSMEASGIQGRTALPGAVLADVTAWKLWGGLGAEPETLLVEFSSAGGATVYLEEGTWHFTLNGFRGTDEILRGSIASQNISLEGPNVLAFTVAPVLSGSGTFKMTINLPAGHGISEAKVFQNGTQVDTLTPENDALVFEEDYAAGNYYFSFRLFHGGDLYGVVSETVRVRMNLRSEKTYTLGREDLNLTYVISYDLNGGQLGGGAANPDYYRSTDAAITLPIPALTGYTFGGWYDECNGSTVTVIPQGSMEDKDFYAQWEAIAYTVVYDKNAADAAGDTLSSAHTYDVSAALTTNGFTRTGHVFAGWNTEANGTGTGYDDEEVVENLTAVKGDTVTLFAQWRNEVIVTISVWVNEDGYILYSGNDVTISKSGGIDMDKPTGFSPLVENPYTNIQWDLNGAPIGGAVGTDRNPIIRAADYDIGTYILGVTVTRDGIPYSTDLRFTVIN
jgi:uncharacterized repeat protein (TIGR02543 family)